MPRFCICSYPGCGSRYPKDSRALHFHSIPINEEQRTAWITAIGRKDWNPSKHSVVCSKHFDSDDYEHNQSLNLKYKWKPNLKRGTIPKKYVTECSNKHSSNPALEPSVLLSVSAKRSLEELKLKLTENAKRKSITNTTQSHNIQQNTSDTFSDASTTINTANPVHDLKEWLLLATVSSTEEYSMNEGDLVDQAVKPSLTNPTSKFLEPITQLPGSSSSATKAKSKCDVQIQTCLPNLTASGCQTDVDMVDMATQTDSYQFTSIHCSTPSTWHSDIKCDSNCDDTNVTLGPTYSPSFMEHSVYEVQKWNPYKPATLRVRVEKNMRTYSRLKPEKQNEESTRDTEALFQITDGCCKGHW